MKKRIRRCNAARQEQWQAVLRRWQQGGQSVRAFCRAESVRESAFYFWRRELVRRGHRVDAGSGAPPEARPATPVARSSSRVSPRHSRRASFLPVHLEAPSVTAAACGVEIILAGGRTVRVPAGFDRQTLVDVLAVLEVRPC